MFLLWKILCRNCFSLFYYKLVWEYSIMCSLNCSVRWNFSRNNSSSFYLGSSLFSRFCGSQYEQIERVEWRGDVCLLGIFFYFSPKNFFLKARPKLNFQELLLLVTWKNVAQLITAVTLYVLEWLNECWRAT